MKRLINRLLVKLGLREPPQMYDHVMYWSWSSEYGRLNDDFSVDIEIVEDE